MDAQFQPMRLWMAATAAAALALCACGQDDPAAAQNAPADGAPHVSVAALEDLPTPLPYPYDEDVSPEAVDDMIDAAFERAAAENKRVIVDLGGNWCSWCRSLAGVMELPEVAPFIEDNFETVFVGVSSQQGLTDQNLQVLDRFGVVEVDGVPWLIVAEPDGEVLASSYEVTDQDHETPQAMVNWISQFALRPADPAQS